MSGFKATIEIRAKIYNSENSMLSYIDYDGAGVCYGVDERVVKFFRDLFTAAQEQYLQDQRRFSNTVEVPEEEKWKYAERMHEMRERAELRRLKEKYEGPKLSSTHVPDCVGHYRNAPR